MPNDSPLFQVHHAIEQQTLGRNPLLKALVDSGRFEMNATSNLINMPNDKALAHALGVSPHSGGPIKEYRNGLKDAIDDLAATKDGQAALRGDPDALDRIAARVHRLGDTAQIAIINGDLRTNTGLGQTISQARAQTQSFFNNPDGYANQHAPQLDAHGQASPGGRNWALVTHNEARVLTTLQYFQDSGQPLTRGGNIDLQRNVLSQGISDAYHNGRLSLSPGGVLVVENTLGEEAAKPLRMTRGQQGFASMELLMGEASARNLVRSGGLLATGADAIMTARRAAELLEQGNTTAAQSEFNHALARNAGGWIGGGSTALALGGSGFLPAAVVAADALLLSKAFEKGADLADNRAIYRQIDKADVEWQFNGRSWVRQAVFEPTAGGPGNPGERDVVASYEKSQELGAMASAKAVELALGKAPLPQDPFKIPAQASDQRGLDNQDWRRNADTLLWERQVKTSVSGANDRGSYETQIATPERARQLNQEALGRIESNIATGREAIATAYLEGRAAQRAHEHGVDVPAAVESARARPDAVLGSDNRLYQRDGGGQWIGHDGAATGNLAVELGLTQQMRQPSLEQAQQQLAALQAAPAPTAAQTEKNEMLHRYASAGINLNVNPETQQAIALAVQRTLETHGITGRTMQQLQPERQGLYGYDCPIAHYQAGPDGVAHKVAVTSSDELRQAWREIQAQRREQAPVPDAPELRIEALSPQERETFQQALREANRQGVSTLEAQQVASFAAANLHTPTPDESRAPQAAVDVERQRETTPTPDVLMQAASAQAATAPSIAAGRTEQSAPVVHTDPPRTEPEVRTVSKPAEDSAERDARSDQSSSVLPASSVPREQETRLVDTQAQQPSSQRAAPHSTESLIPPQPASSLPDSTQRHASEDQHHRNQALPTELAERVQVASAPKPEAWPAAQHPVMESGTNEVRQTHATPQLAPVPPAADIPSNTVEDLPATGTERVTPSDQPATPQPAMTPMQAGHPDYALYQQVRDGVAALDAKHGREFDETSERMTASLLVLAKGSGLERVDHVLLSNATPQLPAAHNVFVVQGELNDPAHQRARMPTEQAIQIPVEESLQQFNVVSREQQQRVQAQQLEQQLHDEREQQTIQSRAASMG